MMRISELVAEGVAATTVSRLLADGAVLRLSRGLYQLADAEIDINHDLAEAAKRVPKGVVCLTSALAYHELTDQRPRKVWMAIGTKEWAPVEQGPRQDRADVGQAATVRRRDPYDRERQCSDVHDPTHTCRLLPPSEVRRPKCRDRGTPRDAAATQSDAGGHCGMRA
jgi:hypothetical protein